MKLRHVSEVLPIYHHSSARRRESNGADSVLLLHVDLEYLLPKLDALGGEPRESSAFNVDVLERHQVTAGVGSVVVRRGRWHKRRVRSRGHPRFAVRLVIVTDLSSDLVISSERDEPIPVDHPRIGVVGREVRVQRHVSRVVAHDPVVDGGGVKVELDPDVPPHLLDHWRDLGRFVIGECDRKLQRP